jgi:hypothetical protein
MSDLLFVDDYKLKIGRAPNICKMQSDAQTAAGCRTPCRIWLRRAVANCITISYLWRKAFAVKEFTTMKTTIAAVALALALSVPGVAAAKPTVYPPPSYAAAFAWFAVPAHSYPAQFDPATHPVPSNTNIYRLPYKKVWDWCRAKIAGCSREDRGYHAIVIDEALSPAQQQLVINHELAHLLGWHHPNETPGK